MISGLHKNQKIQENKGTMQWEYMVVLNLFLVWEIKKESRKLAKIHVHHKYSANMLSIMHSQRNQKVLITRMKNKPEQNTNEGGSTASVSEILTLMLKGTANAQHISLLGLQWTGFLFLVFFWAPQNLTGFGFILLVHTKIPIEIPYLRLPVVLYLEIMWKHLLPIPFLCGIMAEQGFMENLCLK